MPGSAAPIALTIVAVDATAKTIDAINARMAAFGKKTQANVERATAPVRSLGNAIKTFGDISGVTRVGSAFGSLARAGNDAYQKVGQIIPLLGIVGSAATVAGVTRMVTAWSEFGSKVEFASQRIGIAASGLSGLQGAAHLAGSSADSLTGGLQALGQTMYDSIGGRNVEAIKMFRTLKIGFEDATGHARKVADVLPEVADKIKAIKDPFAQAQVATALFGGAAESLLPFLRLGSAGMRRYVEDAKRYGAISDASAAAANRLREAQARVSLAIEGFSNRIAERLEPILTPLLTHFAEWIATSPQVARGVEWLGTKVDQLGGYLNNVDWASVQQTWEGWGTTIGNVTTALGGPQKAIEGLMILMAASFALKVIGPFLTLGSAIAGATFKMSALTAGMAGMTGKNLLTTMLGRGAGLAGGLGLAGLAWEGANLAQDATQPAGNGFANLLHNMIFDMNPTHWTQSYHPGQDSPAAPSGPPGRGQAWGATYDGANATQGGGGERNIRNNNPSNLTFAGQAGAVSDGRFARFKNMETGVAADLNQFLLYQDRDRLTSIAGMINKATPISENPGVRDYIDRVSRQMGVSPNDRVNLHDPDTAKRFIMAVSPNEGGTPDAGAVARGVALRLGAQGAPMALASGGQGSDGGRDSTVKLQIDGRMDKGMSMNVVGAQGATVSGPLVERPQLLGANP